MHHELAVYSTSRIFHRFSKEPVLSLQVQLSVPLFNTFIRLPFNIFQATTATC
jgi:hypothetical protein